MLLDATPSSRHGQQCALLRAHYRFECACEARNASAVEQLKVPCSFQVSQGADGIAAHAFRKLKWPEDCPAHQPPPQARGVTPL